MHIAAALALLATCLASAQVFNRHTDPFYLALKASGTKFDGTSLIACVHGNVWRQLCWWSAPAASQKRPLFRFEYNDSDQSEQGYLFHNLTTVQDDQKTILSTWVPMGFDLSSTRNAVAAEFVTPMWADSLITQLFRLDAEGRLVMQYFDQVAGQGMGLGNWFMCAILGSNARTVLHWGIGLSPDAEDLDAKDCVKVEVVRA